MVGSAAFLIVGNINYSEKSHLFLYLSLKALNGLKCNFEPRLFLPRVSL